MSQAIRELTVPAIAAPPCLLPLPGLVGQSPHTGPPPSLTLRPCAHLLVPCGIIVSYTGLSQPQKRTAKQQTSFLKQNVKQKNREKKNLREEGSSGESCVLSGVSRRCGGVSGRGLFSIPSAVPIPGQPATRRGRAAGIICPFPGPSGSHLALSCHKPRISEGTFRRIRFIHF